MKKNPINDKYTIGNSPAAIYLADLLSVTTNSTDFGVIRFLNVFRQHFNELIKAHNKGYISKKVVFSYMYGKRLELEEQVKTCLDNGYTPLIVNLYKNLVVAEMKQFTRTSVKKQAIEQSATERAKALLKNKGVKQLANTSLDTYGKSVHYVNNTEKTFDQIDATVTFNEYGVPKVIVDLDQIKDTITNETLREKSLKRLTRLGKTTDYYN
jgi:hypothetical protein